MARSLEDATQDEIKHSAGSVSAHCDRENSFACLSGHQRNEKLLSSHPTQHFSGLHRNQTIGEKIFFEMRYLGMKFDLESFLCCNDGEAGDTQEDEMENIQFSDEKRFCFIFVTDSFGRGAE